MANKRGGLSKREYAAKLSGGKLDYKTGKISVPVKKAPAVKSTYQGAGPWLPGQKNVASQAWDQASVQGPLMQSGAFYSKEPVSSKRNQDVSTARAGATAIATPSSNRSLAQQAISGLTGAKVAGASTSKPTYLAATAIGSLLNKITSPVSSLVGKLTGEYAPELTKSLELLGLGGVLDETVQTGLAEDTTKDQDYYNNVNAVLNSGGNINSDDFQNAYKNLTERTLMNSVFSPTARESRSTTQTPSRVSQPTPYTAPQVFPGLSNPYQGRQDSEPMQADNGTVRRPVGMGEFSRGQYGNGAGGYGFQGSLGGDSTGFAEDLLQNILGINTAQASEGPANQFLSDQYLSPMGVSFMGSQSPLGIMNANSQASFNNQNGLEPDIQQQYQEDMDTSIPAPTPQYQQPRATQQGAPQGMPEQGFSTKGYDKQIKAQKKALDELIKSIKKEYEQSKATGTTALEKAKQEDLLKLSGLFSFANQDPNSEQRVQYQNRMTADYAGQLTDFLNKLAQGQSKDIAGAKTNYSSTLADIIAQMERAKQAYEDKMWNRRYQMSKKSSGGGYTDPWSDTGDELL